MYGFVYVSMYIRRRPHCNEDVALQPRPERARRARGPLPSLIHLAGYEAHLIQPRLARWLRGEGSRQFSQRSSPLPAFRVGSSRPF